MGTGSEGGGVRRNWLFEHAYIKETIGVQGGLTQE